MTKYYVVTPTYSISCILLSSEAYTILTEDYGVDDTLIQNH